VFPILNILTAEAVKFCLHPLAQKKKKGSVFTHRHLLSIKKPSPFSSEQNRRQARGHGGDGDGGGTKAQNEAHEDKERCCRQQGSNRYIEWLNFFFGNQAVACFSLRGHENFKATRHRQDLVDPNPLARC
jgi:hypothetical protein